MSQAVLEKLISDHVGEHNAITQSQLQDALDMNTSTLRSEIRRLREQRELPIANQGSGYYVIQDKDELQDYIGYINGEIQSRKQTIEYTLEAFENADDIEATKQPTEPTWECAQCGKAVPKSESKRPTRGEYEGEVLCKVHYGQLVMQGEA